MSLNKNKLKKLLISNLSNAIVHEILEKAIDISEISNKYHKEIINSFQIAKKYRDKINPVDKILPMNDSKYIREQIIKNVYNELNIRIIKGYKNIDLTFIEELVDQMLKEMIII